MSCPSRLPWRRVHIVGGAGSGKSTLADRLAVCLAAPHYHLDNLNFVGSGERPRPREERDARMRCIVARPAWVTDGIYLGWTDPLLEAADRIIWLDLPRRVALYRIVRRYVLASLRGSNEYQGLRRLLRFLLWSAAYYRPTSQAQIDALPEESTHSRAATARHLRPYAHKLTRCCSSAAVEDLLAALGGAAGPP